ncbi:MAG: 2-C-methyl-D-erythritol 4-phosphate cytidylyltransferase [Oscillospiraceae bacterium]|nr:2-C-methyl-D-erythritol 4-phosphate cytidylyltransferase [Oscillospiraceae bacterium]
MSEIFENTENSKNSEKHRPDTSVILVCAGNASRMNGVNKILMPLGNSNVIGICMQAFQNCPDVAEIIIVTKPESAQTIRETAESLQISKLKEITDGGATRQESVMQGLRLVSKSTDYIAIHDGARPLVKPEHITKVIHDAKVFGGATLGVPVKDTIKTVDEGLITDTPPRSSLWITQTPQVFRKRLYFEAVDFALEHHLNFTDDCQLIESIGGKICMTTGDYTNIKITTPEDRAIAEVLLS